MESFRGPTVQGAVMIEATFLNPDLANGERWEHGFMLKGKPGNTFHVIYILGGGAWRHSLRLGKGEPTTSIRQEVFSGIDKNSGGKNRMRLVVIGSQGWLFINNQPQGQLDLSGVEYDRADLSLWKESAGAVTRFEHFNVWKWHPSLQKLSSAPGTPNAGPLTSSDLAYAPVYGPASGVIIHDLQRPTNRLEVFRGPLVEGDLMVEATFHNPSAGGERDWNYGFLLRQPELGMYQWIYITPGSWVSKWRPSLEDYTQTIRDRRSSLIDQTPGGTNQLRLVVIGNEVDIFINGKYAGHTTILGSADNAPITLAVNDEWEGVTRFDGFTVWEWHPSLQKLPADN